MKHTSKEFGISDNIKKYRKLNNLTQEQLSDLLNLDTQYYAQCERGERNFALDCICKAASIFEIGIEDIIEIPQKESEPDQAMLARITAYLDGLNKNQLTAVEKVITDIIPFIK